MLDLAMYVATLTRFFKTAVAATSGGQRERACRAAEDLSTYRHRTTAARVLNLVRILC
jgi:hypothetical protein